MVLVNLAYLAAAVVVLFAVYRLGYAFGYAQASSALKDNEDRLKRINKTLAEMEDNTLINYELYAIWYHCRVSDDTVSVVSVLKNDKGERQAFLQMGDPGEGFAGGSKTISIHKIPVSWVDETEGLVQAWP